MVDTQKPTTPRAKKTYNNLLKSAEEIFEKQGFFRASVVEICNNADVSNGTFYRYFNDKNEIFVKLADRLGRDLTEEIQDGFDRSDSDFDLRIETLLRDYFSFLNNNSSLYRIFRQAEFVNWDTHQVFYNNLIEKLAAGLELGRKEGYFRNHDKSLIAHYLLGTLSFVSMRWVVWEQCGINGKIIENLLDFLKKGLEKKSQTDEMAPPYFDFQDREQLGKPAAFGDKREVGKTKSKLLAAAERCFGVKGFYGTTIGDITREAEVAQGTFYHHFSSKLEVFETLVHEINELWREKVRNRTRHLSDRRRVELEGFRVFFSFIAKHSSMYRIVREAEFVEKSLGRWYYESFAGSYKEALKKAMAEKKIRELDPEVLAYSLMGIGHFLGQKWYVQENRNHTPPAEFNSMFELILHGLEA